MFLLSQHKRVRCVHVDGTMVRVSCTIRDDRGTIHHSEGTL